MIKCQSVSLLKEGLSSTSLIIRPDHEREISQIICNYNCTVNSELTWVEAGIFMSILIIAMNILILSSSSSSLTLVLLL